MNASDCIAVLIGDLNLAAYRELGNLGRDKGLGLKGDVSRGKWTTLAAHNVGAERVAKIEVFGDLDHGQEL